ncbi:vitamin K epoxide reductase family protein [Chryseobacterium indoltheticum]|uniref:Vitamin K epoxide reductase family protein n=1 Tax=Chryseobacterium indoltheticum TaxID=254 RepID=A0A3G6NDK1_9FLAO|nr:vitamin K epoxide reductase family protein [Chryseobacterium indoltheticum]AZA63023.1 vitamin K epoxide reductase family protein [Chryseobacterium indoltheticum]
MKENLFLLIDKFLGNNRILNEDKNLELDLLSLGSINIYNIFKILSKYVKDIDLYDISESTLNELPKTFIGTNKRNIPILVDKKDNELFVENIKMSASAIEPYIIASTQENSLMKYLLKRYTSLLVTFLGTFFLILFLWYNLLSVNQKLFMLLSFVGTFLALLSNKDLFESNSILNNFCSKKCSVVQNSKDWKILNFLDFGVLSLTYFLTQIIVILLFRNDIFPVLAKISYISYFFVIISVCYQIYLKKICKICIFTSAVLLLQGILSYDYKEFYINWDLLSKTIFFSGAFLFLFYCILMIKKYVANTGFYKKESIKSKKISNNPEYISRIILNSSKIFPPKLLDTSDTKIEKITLFIYTSITCNHCRDLHSYLSQIIDDFGEKLDIKFSFFIDFEDSEQELILMYKKLALMLIRDEFQRFHHILGELYKDYYESINNYTFNPTQEENIKILNYFAESNHWSDHNNVYYAPFILIDNHHFSHEFDYSILYNVIERLTP